MPKINDAIFIWIPKNCGTTIFRALTHHGFHSVVYKPGLPQIKSGLNTFIHRDVQLLLKNGFIDKDYFNRAFKFCFVRNPWKRAVSVSYEVNSHGNCRNWNEFVNHLENMAVEPIGTYDWHGMSPSNPQYQWITKRYLSQSGVISAYDDYLVDFIGKVENLQEDYDKVCERLGVETTKLGHENKGKYEKKYYEHYDERSLRIISSFYAGDIKRFNYNMPVELKKIYV